MAKQKNVKIQKDDLEGEVLEESVPAWEENGWTVVDDGNNEPVEVVAAEEARPVEGVSEKQKAAPAQPKNVVQQPENKE